MSRSKEELHIMHGFHYDLRRALGRPPGWATVLALVLVVSSRLALASCAPDPDTDGDGICDPVDNCVAVANPDQADTYGASGSPAGQFGDACEAIEADLNVTKVKIRAASGSTNPKGKVTVKGDFVLLASESFAPPEIGARIVDAINFDQSTPLPAGVAAACVVSPSGRSIRCKQPGPQETVQTTAVFKFSNAPAGAPRVVQFSLKLAKLSVGGTAFAEPVTVTLSDPGSGIDRVGVITDCAATNGQLTCREF
ncbi:MAG: thrombospondin type 3 repeat-containing protein [Candidatus Binatia bacterium]